MKISCVAIPRTLVITRDGSISIGLLRKSLSKYFRLKIVPPVVVR